MELLDKILSHNSELEVIKLLLNQDKEQKFNEAMLQFKSVVPAIPKTEQGQNLIGEVYDYARLEDIQEKIKQHLIDNNLSYRFNQKQRGNVVTVQCVVTHVAGGSSSTTMSAHIQETGALVSEQQTATTTSYLKRYTIVNALGLIIEGQDTDASTQRFNGLGGTNTHKTHNEAVKALRERLQPEQEEPEPQIELEVPNNDEELEAVLGDLEQSWKEEEQREPEQSTENVKRFEIRAMVEEHQDSDIKAALFEISEQGAILDHRELVGFHVAIVDAEREVIIGCLNSHGIDSEVVEVPGDNQDV